MKSKYINALIVLAVLAVLGLACMGMQPRQDGGEELPKGQLVDKTTRGIYHWKTTFNLTADDVAFLEKHNINQLYVRMFDVGMEDDWNYGIEHVEPLGTTVFKSPVPKNCKVIPTVYITLNALQAYKGKECDLADLIIERVFAMASWNDLGEISEVQFDCDWTSSTRQIYEILCKHARKVLKSKGAILSGTIRLHQIEEAYYPFDKGVVMIYNTGSLADRETKNSIINYDDVSKYLSVKRRIDKFLKAREKNCPIIEMAYPTYSWGVVYDLDKKFNRLVSCREDYEINWYEYVRWETSEIDEIIKVKELVDNTIGRASQGNIIYHLESENLTKYSSDEIENIYN